MEREDALEWARKGHKITHITFKKDEFVCFKKGKYYFENDEIVDMEWIGHFELKWNWELYYG